MKRWGLALVVASLLAAPAATGWAGQGQRPAGARSDAGVVIGANVEGHVVVFDQRHRLVIEVDKTAGRTTSVGLKPGTYDVRIEGNGAPVQARVDVRGGSFTILEQGQFSPTPPADPGRQAGGPSPEPGRGPLVVERRPLDRAHRIELHFGLTNDRAASVVAQGDDVHWGSGDVGGGFEYLHYVSPDLAVGFAIDSQARGEGARHWWDDGFDTGRATVAMPIVVRWNFARRLTDFRGFEPYVTGGVGPVFRVDWAESETGHWHTRTSADVSTTIGGRVGAGVDARLSSVFTLGIVGVWRWSDRPHGVTGYGKDDRGGEVAFTMGFNFGRQAHRR